MLTAIRDSYAVGLLTLSPLGDLVRRRPLVLILAFMSASLSIGLAITKNLAVFEALSFLVGTFSVVPQVLMPLAADLAPPERRASALSIVLAGLLLGVLVARVLAGVVAQFVTWRVVYYIAIGVQWILLFVLWAVLPDWPAKNKDLTYFGILWSMGKFLLTEPLLIQAVLVNIASSACFTNFWVSSIHLFLLDDDLDLFTGYIDVPSRRGSVQLFHVSYRYTLPQYMYLISVLVLSLVSSDLLGFSVSQWPPWSGELLTGLFLGLLQSSLLASCLSSKRFRQRQAVLTLA